MKSPMMEIKMRLRRQRGAVLMLAMWALFILSAAIMVWIQFVRQTLVVGGEQQLDIEARAMTHSGGALAMHPLVSKETPALMMAEGQNPGFQVRMISEGGKLNVNTLLLGEDPRKIEIFKRWLEYRGIQFNDRERIVDCMLDYMDADNLKRLNGEEDLQGYHPPNRGQFISVDEVKQVIGLEQLTGTAGWDNDLTIFSGGTIDITAAEAHILRLLPGLNDPGIEQFLQYRRGADQIDGTYDDPVFQKLDQAQPFLGINKAAFNALGGLIGLRDNAWHIHVDGWSGNVHRQLEVVVRKGGANPQILDWKE
jgi:general secretion pathway protein K